MLRFGLTDSRLRGSDGNEIILQRQPVVYILASRKCGTLYIGVTSDLIRRLQQHRDGSTKGFTTRYRVHKLVYFEQFEDMVTAIAREKQMKKWRRDWKLNLIEHSNPEWLDLAIGLGFEHPNRRDNGSPPARG